MALLLAASAAGGAADVTIAIIEKAVAALHNTFNAIFLFDTDVVVSDTATDFLVPNESIFRLLLFCCLTPACANEMESLATFDLFSVSVYHSR